MPIDRPKSLNTVQSVVQVLGERKIFRLALALEDIWKKATRLKTGFYRIAKKAKVPVVVAAFDHEGKRVKISGPVKTTDNMCKDLEFIHNFYKGVVGKVAEHGFQVFFKGPDLGFSVFLVLPGKTKPVLE